MRNARNQRRDSGFYLNWWSPWLFPQFCLQVLRLRSTAFGARKIKLTHNSVFDKWRKRKPRLPFAPKLAAVFQASPWPESFRQMVAASPKAVMFSIIQTIPVRGI